ncbi:hypothetical protein C7E17_00695 [Stenotrophomonas maltophilia]|nr:hypothetical protein C7E17_00695 [Stenotrophomonas maltophilia]PZS56232.1 hypothetical protein A7X56_12345 [Stenotrophomonas maltophilia]QBL46363.1 hypothetical protein LBG_18035 [Stenotrophomonas maltophilia]HEP1208715.1 hypothetical protein [Stenotrophomonas maltophilia]
MQNQNTATQTGVVMGIDAQSLSASIVGLILTIVGAKAIAVYFAAPIMLFLLPAAVLIGMYMCKPARGRTTSVAIATALLIAAALVSNGIPDPTWDGNMYHKVAMVALHDGWNPWSFPELSDWMKTQTGLEYSNSVWDSNIADSWISHYPNASWLFGAAMMDYGFGWESAKAISLLLAVAVTFYSVSVFRQWITSTWMSGLLAAAVVLCQPLLAQAGTNYVDGMTYALCALILLALLDRNRGSAVRTVVWCSLILLAGLKFTGALYGALLAVPFVLVFRPRIREMAIWGVIGIGILSHPYLNHVVSGLPVGYPVTSGDQILAGQAEKAMLAQSRPHSLMTSLLSKASNSLEMPGLKVPGTIHSGEILISGSPDTRYSGFGPLFSLALLLGLVASIAATIEAWRQRDLRAIWRLLACIAYVLVLTLIHAAPWWARYVPFLQFGLVIALLVGMRARAGWIRGFAVAGCFVLLVNGLLVGVGIGGYLGRLSVKQGLATDRQIVHRHARGESVIIRSPSFIAFPAIYHGRENLGLERIEYIPVTLDQLNCGGHEELGTWIGLAKFCRGDKAP